MMYIRLKLVVIAFAITLFSFHAYSFVSSEESSDKQNLVKNPDTLTKLYQQSRKTQKDALLLLKDIYALEESIIFPENDQLIVFMKQNYRAEVLLQQLNVHIDGQLIKSLQFQMGDLEILMNRGMLRLAALLVPPGKHLVEVEILTVNTGPIKQKFDFDKLSRPQFINLSLAGKKIVLEEWKNR